MLETALGLSGDERDRYIARECQGDEALQAELLELIALDDDQTGGLHSAIDGALRQALPSLSGGQADSRGDGEQNSASLSDLSFFQSEEFRPQAVQTLNKGNRIGQFEIQRLLGSGGMGEVYEALQLEPVQRTVAVKVIRYGAQDPGIMARFDSERQTLALMSHPAIAAVYDAGYAPDGRPYFAMELVDGVPIDAYLREHRLSLQKTLELLISVCRGVQHAHQRGVIHRDLKPSNILVIEQDGRPTPKIIDFGIAKAASTVNPDNEHMTQVGQLIGTLRYMSPEQADSMGVDVDTRSDVYAVGTIFYEILTGRHPLNPEAMSSASFAERQRAFREYDPLPPSRVTDSSTPAARSPSELKGDLDWILLKALQKDREQRYSSVGELARDLERHLKNEPVEASPPTARYRWSKFYRRNRIGVLAAAAVTASIIIGVAMGTVGFVRALAAEKEAVIQAEAAGEVSQFLVGLFEASDPNKGGSADTTARELLDRGAQQLDGRLNNQPNTKAQLLQTLGNVYEILGLLNESFDKRFEAAQVLASLENADPLRHASVLADLSVSYRRRGDFQDAHDMAEKALATFHGTRSNDGAAESYILSALGIAKLTLGKYEEAEPVLQDSLRLVSDAAPGSAGHATSAYNLAGLYNYMGRFSEAIPLVQQAIDIRLQIDPDAPRIGDMYDGMGILQLGLGQYGAAADSMKKGLEARRDYFGDDHYLVGLSLQNLAEVAYVQGDYLETAAMAAEAISISERAEGDIEWRHLAAQYELLAMASAPVGRLEQAYAAVSRAKALRAEYTPEDHPDALLAEHAEAMVMLEDGHYGEAAERLERILEHRQTGISADGLDLYEALVRAYTSTEQYPRAEALCKQSAEKLDLQNQADNLIAVRLKESCARFSRPTSNAAE
ncbi:hypothetical protein BA177_03780 [Woeseia oceani]|uniref:Protein kinase domain-containing protein n=2 Tax=Woeseia oceani TaxID=1548547 RepID=A0A193LD41_9GAMM|nr:hypothetical protein BA177_03780 [Woeseia oceani]